MFVFDNPISALSLVSKLVNTFITQFLYSVNQNKLLCSLAFFSGMPVATKFCTSLSLILSKNPFFFIKLSAYKQNFSTSSSITRALSPPNWSIVNSTAEPLLFKAFALSSISLHINCTPLT